MRKLPSNGKQVLVFIAFSCLLIACAGKEQVNIEEIESRAFEDLRNELREVIVDQARETEAIGLVNSLQNNLQGLRSSIAERRRRLDQLNADYDASREEFEVFLEGIEEEVFENRQRVGSTHIILLSLLSKDELAEIDKAHSSAMKVIAQNIQLI